MKKTQVAGLILLAIGIPLIAYSPFVYTQNIIRRTEERMHSESVLQEKFIVGPRSNKSYSIHVNLTQGWYNSYFQVNGSLFVYVLNNESFKEWRETGEVHEVLTYSVAVGETSYPQYLSIVLGEEWVHLIFDNTCSLTPSESKEVLLNIERVWQTYTEISTFEGTWTGVGFVLLGAIFLLGSIALVVGGMGIGGKPAYEPLVSVPAPPPLVRVCLYCGAQNPANESFCHRCGEKLSIP